MGLREDELFRVVLQKNAEYHDPVNEELLQQILSIVLLNPIEKDRGSCQAQIDYLINQFMKRGR